MEIKEISDQIELYTGIVGEENKKIRESSCHNQKCLQNALDTLNQLKHYKAYYDILTKNNVQLKNNPFFEEKETTDTKSNDKVIIEHFKKQNAKFENDQLKYKKITFFLIGCITFCLIYLYLKNLKPPAPKYSSI